MENLKWYWKGLILGATFSIIDIVFDWGDEPFSKRNILAIIFKMIFFPIGFYIEYQYLAKKKAKSEKRF